MNLIDIFIVMVILCISDLVLEIYKKRLAKKCNYDCKSCKVFDCRGKQCNEKFFKNLDKEYFDYED